MTVSPKLTLGQYAKLNGLSVEATIDHLNKTGTRNYHSDDELNTSLRWLLDRMIRNALEETRIKTNAWKDENKEAKETAEAEAKFKESNGLFEIKQQYQADRVPHQTIRQYVGIYNLSLERAIDELNNLGFQCNADDEITSSIQTKLIEIHRALLKEKRERLADNQKIIYGEQYDERRVQEAKAKEAVEAEAESKAKAVEAKAKELAEIRLKEAELEALKQRYKQSLNNFNFNNLYVIADKKSTDTPNSISYSLSCRQNELEEIYTSVWDSEEALIKWKNANSVDDEHCAIDCPSFESLILKNTQIKWALLNPLPEMVDYKAAESIGVEKMMLLSANGVWPLLEHHLSTQGRDDHIITILKQSVSENFSMTVIEFISNIDKLIEEKTSSLLSILSYVEQFENDIKLDHVVLNDIICFDGDIQEISKASIDLFGHCFKFTYGIYNKVINAVFDSTKELTIEVIDTDDENVKAVILDKIQATLTTKVKLYSGGLVETTLNDNLNFTSITLFLNEENIKILREHYRKVNQLTSYLSNYYKKFINSMVIKLLDDTDLVEIGKNFIDESSNNFYTDEGYLFLVEEFIFDNYSNRCNSLLLSSKEMRYEYFSNNTESIKSAFPITHRYCIENLAMFAIFLQEKIGVINNVLSFYVTYVFIYNVVIEHLGKKWEDEYKQHFNDIRELSLYEAIERYCSIATVVHSDNVSLGRFIYYLIKNGKFDNNDRNYFNCLKVVIPNVNQIMGIKKYNNFVNRLSTSTTSSQTKYTINDVDLMNGVEFEKFIAELFSKMGYESEITKASGDQGIDVIASKNGSSIGIQAKCYSSSVGNGAIQEAVAGKNHYRLDKAIVVTNNFFTEPAQQLAQSNSIILWDRHILKEKIDEIFNSSIS